MRNPLRDEGAAFRLVLAAIGYFGLIALGSWISTWLGVAVFLVLTAGVVWFVWTGRREDPARHRVAATPAGSRRILVVANETVEGAELLDAIRDRVQGGRADIFVVSPALNSKLRHWVSDEDGAREAAQARLDRSIARLDAIGLPARGEIGDADPVQAVEDALRGIGGVDEIVLSTHPEGRSHWLERGVVESVRQRFDVPLTHVVVDLERQPTA